MSRCSLIVILDGSWEYYFVLQMLVLCSWINHIILRWCFGAKCFKFHRSVLHSPTWCNKIFEQFWTMLPWEKLVSFGLFKKDSLYINWMNILCLILYNQWAVLSTTFNKNIKIIAKWNKKINATTKCKKVWLRETITKIYLRGSLHAKNQHDSQLSWEVITDVRMLHSYSSKKKKKNTRIRQEFRTIILMIWNGFFFHSWLF